MIALVIVLAVLAALLLLPLGAQVRYDAGGVWLWLIFGPFRLRLLPKKPKKGKTKKKSKKKSEKPKEPKPPKEKKEKPSQPIGGLIRDFYPFVKLGLELVGCFFRKLRVDSLTIHVSFGGTDDPASAAINYGRAWAAIGALMPQLRRALRIRRENVSASCDFTSGQMRIYAELRATFLLGDLLAMLLRYGFRALRLFLAMKQRKKQNHSDKAVQVNESSSS